MTNPNLPTQDKLAIHQDRLREYGLPFLLLVGCVLSPIVVCFLVVFVVFGPIRGLYWATDGLLISSVLNGVFATPLLFQIVRASATQYLAVCLCLNCVITFLVYGYFIIALSG